MLTVKPHIHNGFLGIKDTLKEKGLIDINQGKGLNFLSSDVVASGQTGA